MFFKTFFVKHQHLHTLNNEATSLNSIKHLTN